MVGRKPNALKKAESLDPSPRENISDVLPQAPATAGLPSLEKRESAAARTRRSARNQGVVVPSENQNQGFQPDIVELDPHDLAERDSSEPELIRKTLGGKLVPESDMGQRSTEEKLDCMFRLLSAQQELIDGLASKVAKISSTDQSAGVAEYNNYKDLYMDSQKKVEALKSENCQLSMKLENATARLDVYEKMFNSFSEVMEKIKDALLLSSLASATETAFNLSSPRRRGAATPKPAAEPNLSSLRRRGAATPKPAAEPNTSAAKKRKVAKENNIK